MLLVSEVTYLKDLDRYPENAALVGPRGARFSREADH